MIRVIVGSSHLIGIDIQNASQQNIDTSVFRKIPKEENGCRCRVSCFLFVRIHLIGDK